MVDGIRQQVKQKFDEFRQEPGLIGLEAQVALEEAAKPAQTSVGRGIAALDTFVHGLATATALPVVHFVGDAAAAVYGGAKYGAGVLSNAMGADAALGDDLKNSGKRSLLAAAASAGSAVANVVPVAGAFLDSAGSAAAHGYATKVSLDATGITRRDVDSAIDAARPHVDTARSRAGELAESAKPVVNSAQRRATEAIRSFRAPQD